MVDVGGLIPNHLTYCLSFLCHWSCYTMEPV